MKPITVKGYKAAVAIGMLSAASLIPIAFFSIIIYGLGLIALPILIYIIVFLGRSEKQINNREALNGVSFWAYIVLSLVELMFLAAMLGLLGGPGRPPRYAQDFIYDLWMIVPFGLGLLSLIVMANYQYRARRGKLSDGSIADPSSSPPLVQSQESVQAQSPQTSVPPTDTPTRES